jgi:hypothetical protein
LHRGHRHTPENTEDTMCPIIRSMARLALAGAVASSATGAHAVVITVDVGDQTAVGTCSLAAAINAANQNGPSEDASAAAPARTRSASILRSPRSRSTTPLPAPSTRCA